MRQRAVSTRQSSLGPRPLAKTRTCKNRATTSRRSSMSIITLVRALLSFAIVQLLAIPVLHRSYPSVPTWHRGILESLLIPLLPLTRHGGKFTLATFRRKWLYWPMTRARRLLLKLSDRVMRVEPTVLYVNTTDGSYRRYSISNLPSKPLASARYAVISDTHLLHGDLTLPPGDVLIHCGDILVEDKGEAGQGQALLNDFNEWLGFHDSMFRFRLVTAGNHDQILQDMGTSTAKSILRNGIYLNDERIHLNFTTDSENDNCQHQIYASAASRGYKSGGNTAFQYTTDESANAIWAKIPSSGVDILVTHGAPNGILDGTASNAGCPILLEHVQTRIKPRVHVFGHWHDAPGSVKIGGTVFINAASVDFDYAASHSPVVFDLAFLNRE